MLQSARDLRGYTIRASDGDIGEIYDVYFDDESWSVRYVVVETGNWLFNRRVLLSPSAFERSIRRTRFSGFIDTASGAG